MKKGIILTLVITLAFLAIGCGANGSEQTTVPQSNQLEGSLEDILAAIYEKADVESSFAEYIETGLQTVDITSDRSEFYFGTDVTFEEAIASEPIMSPSAYLLSLVRVSEEADIEAIMEDIRENVDPMRWICVGVDPDNIVVDHIGNVIILIMSDQEKDTLHQAFESLA